MNDTFKNKFRLNLQQTEQTVPDFKFTKNDLDKAFEDQKFIPEKLILLLKKQYSDIYNQDAGVREGYTLEQHTLMVMKQFEKYFGDKDLPSGVDKNIFRLILALHDIGKPEAISRGGKHLQHRYTQKYIQSLFRHLGIDEKHTNLALVLVSGDPIGKYLTSRMDAGETRRIIEKMANRAKIPAAKIPK